MLVSVIIGLILAAATTTASDGAPLHRGLFVDHRERCDAGHGYRYSNFDGQSLTFGAPPISVKLRRVAASVYVGDYRDADGAPRHDRFAIKSPTRFTWSGRDGTFRLKYCPKSSLPPAWR